MILSKNPRIDLTYCMNVHPGRSWEDQRRAVEETAMRVRESVAPGKPFGLGLRIANRASVELEKEEKRAEAAEFFRENNCYPFTINGFPYDHFHGTMVKEKVYLPDWQRENRRYYTCRLAELLAFWLPEGMEGSISTVPGSYKEWIQSKDEVSAMVSNLIETVLVLDEIRDRTGREIHLGLEPEPDCFLETTEETVRFFENELFQSGVGMLATRKGVSKSEAETIVRRHLGVCFDTCHLALQFEDLVEAWKKLKSAGIRISKVQVSNALEVRSEKESWERLKDFVEPVYLHQVKGKKMNGEVVGWSDLPAALAEMPKLEEDFERLRVHFHIPLFFEGTEKLGTTQPSLTPEFFKLLQNEKSLHLEIETYTYDVLPESIRPATLVESVRKEYEWVLERFDATI